MIETFRKTKEILQDSIGRNKVAFGETEHLIYLLIALKVIKEEDIDVLYGYVWDAKEADKES